MSKPNPGKMKKIKRRISDLDLPELKKLKAVAVKYDAGKAKAPRIVAMGRGVVAEKILKVAEDHKVPFFEDQGLTELLAKLDVNVEIPPELYTLVAEVLAFVYQLDKTAKRRKAKR